MCHGGGSFEINGVSLEWRFAMEGCRYPETWVGEWAQNRLPIPTTLGAIEKVSV